MIRMNYENNYLLELIENNFNINSEINTIDNELVFYLGDEKVSISLKDETNNGYLLFDYMLKFWTLTKDKKTGRGGHIALHNTADLEKTIIDFLDEKVFLGKVYKKGSFTNEWKNPVTYKEPQPVVIKVADDDKKKKAEPLTLFDFM